MVQMETCKHTNIDRLKTEIKTLTVGFNHPHPIEIFTKIHSSLSPYCLF